MEIKSEFHFDYIQTIYIDCNLAMNLQFKDWISKSKINGK